MNNMILVNKSFNEFEYFLLCILILMPVSKKLADICVNLVSNGIIITFIPFFKTYLLNFISIYL